jgi:hypothetical protein
MLNGRGLCPHRVGGLGSILRIKLKLHIKFGVWWYINWLDTRRSVEDCNISMRRSRLRRRVDDAINPLFGREVVGKVRERRPNKSGGRLFQRSQAVLQPLSTIVRVAKSAKSVEKWG